MRILGRFRHAAAARWAAFVMDPWDRRSAAQPFEFDWLADATAR
jgi:hypothetical protein